MLEDWLGKRSPNREVPGTGPVAADPPSAPGSGVVDAGAAPLEGSGTLGIATPAILPVIAQYAVMLAKMMKANPRNFTMLYLPAP